MIFDPYYPPIPWVRWAGRHVDTRRGSEGKTLCWVAGANWREFGVVRHGSSRLGAILLALYSVVGFRLTGNGYFPEKMLF